jgi:hypothetical protein
VIVNERNRFTNKRKWNKLKCVGMTPPKCEMIKHEKIFIIHAGKSFGKEEILV